jgi:protoporphyrinogen oxidase
MSKITRRSAIKLLSKLSCSLYAAPFLASGCRLLSPRIPSLSNSSASDTSPVDRSLADQPAMRGFFGDSPNSAHSILWNKDAFQAERGGLPKPSSHRRVVVIGGGISGLTTAYYLRDINPLIIERDDRFGGNSKAQVWRDISYSIGAAYFCVPDPETPFANLLDELGIASDYRKKSDEDPIAINGSMSKRFWSGVETAANEREQINRAKRYLLGVLNEECAPYPDITLRESSVREAINRLDRTSFRNHLEDKLGTLHPSLAAVIEQFCWSSFAASTREISAASGLNFLAAEFGEIGVFPGGNAVVADALVKRLQVLLKPDSLRAGCTAIDVTTTESGATVTFVNGQDELETVSADRVVMACPKFIAAKILNGLEPERVSAIRALEYRAYLVANLLLKDTRPPDFYNLFLLGDCGSQGNDPIGESRRRGATDAVCANFAAVPSGHSVLTLYRAFPYRGGRAEILSDVVYEGVRSSFERQIEAEILPLLGIAPSAIYDLRITRWGHPLPVAATGLIANGTLDLVQKPIDNKIFFVEQDNWALPAIETAIAEANYWSARIRRSFA